MKNNHLFIFILAVLVSCTDRKSQVQVASQRVADLVYAVGTVKSEREMVFRTGIYCNIGEISVKEGGIIPKGGRLFRCDGINYTAPFTAQVTEIFYREKENVVPGTPVMNLIDLKRLYVQAVLDQHSAHKIRAQQKAFFVSEIFPEGKKETRIESIFPRNDRFLVRLFSDNLTDGILPGMTLDVIIEVAVRENALVVPLKSAMLANRYLCRGKEKRQAPLRPIDTEWAEITDTGEFDYSQFQVCR